MTKKKIKESWGELCVEGAHIPIKTPQDKSRDKIPPRQGLTNLHMIGKSAHSGNYCGLNLNYVRAPKLNLL